ncbi:hypothetical protein [Bacteroides thetaiotaomicron]|uniref:ASCH domain-containing protein n=1 Tax=Bacteroides thetaiotaomicron TaxID=818 RepID=A0A943DU51_BACT4|nr:hypothetical protein [Bacteroides thetaiotaomicron]MBS5410721.1 hypothetical protein [Bacteroides thetaiotaomicron]MDC2233529.1 hypothetical protein [Bacteroides thetaiotaomicron]
MKKIMFNDEFSLTLAVLDGLKTMTRRTISEKLWDRWTDYDDFCNSVSVENTPTTRQYYDEKEFFIDNSSYKVGEVVAIAQSYSACGNIPDCELDEDGYPIMPMRSGFFNKMFVKADLMPHHIEITGIKVERLQDISDEDCLKEGIVKQEVISDESPFLYAYDAFLNGESGYFASRWFKNPKEAFAALIDKVSGKGTWESNPFVFAYEFRLTD